MEKRATVSTSANRPASASKPVASGRPPKPGRKGQVATRSRILGLAFGAGSLAALLAYVWLQSLSAPPKTKAAVTTVPMLTVARDIPARTLITQDMVQVRLVPSEKAAAGALRDAGEVVGKVTTVPIASGYPITPQTIAPPDINMGMAFTLPPSYRAVAVALDPVSAVAGFIKPGDHVDVLATFKGEGSQSVTCIVLQDVLLLATGAKALPGYSASNKTGPESAIASGTSGATPEEVPTATLMVNPEEAQSLVLASASGKIQLTLRSPNDATRPTLARLTSAVFTRGRNSGSAAPAARLHAPNPTSGIRNLPLAENVSLRRAEKSRPALPTVAAPAEADRTPPPAPVQPALQMSLAGVMVGEGGFALFTAGKREWVKKIGEAIAQYRVRDITEDGIWVQSAKGRRELWHIGETWTVLE